VRDDQAQVTHEAAIGTVNRKELESLLARGLDEDEAVDLIIRGMIR
jgi:Fe-S cluster assembly scaffold protein SufB